MQISTKGRYALRMVVDLAKLAEGETRSIHDIAQRQSLSEKYLEQIIRPIAKEDIVGSVRGVQGGYYLKEDPAEITVGRVLRCVEGDLAPVRCVSMKEKQHCDRMATCETVEVWKRIRDAVNEVIDSMTIADLVSTNSDNDARGLCEEIDS